MILTKTTTGPALEINSNIDSPQIGDSALLIWQDALNWNDPLVRIIDNNSGNSSPQIRIDAKAPNMEVVCTSADNTRGFGKWEPWAVPLNGKNMSVNSRAYDDTTFERVGEWSPLSEGGGLTLYPAVNGISGNPAPTGSGQIRFRTTDNRNVGLRGPTTAVASWYWTLPNTFNNLGRLLYQSSDGPDRNLAFTGSDLSYDATGLSAGKLTVSDKMKITGSLVYRISVQTSSYVMSVQDCVVFASSQTNAVSSITLPKVSSVDSGFTAIIFKADQSDTPVVVLAFAGDTIALKSHSKVGLNAVPLESYGSSQQFISNGVDTWFPIGGLLLTSRNFVY